MSRVAPLLLLALVTAGCGARGELITGHGSGSSSSSGGPPPPPSGPPAHIYVADLYNNRIVRMDDMSGAGWATWGELVIGTPCGVAVDAQDRIYFTEAPAFVSRIDDMTGKGYTSYAGPGGDPIGGPNGLALDVAGRIYVVDTTRNRIARIDDMTGAGWVTLGGPDPGSGVGEFDEPLGVAVAKDGRILIADKGNNRVVQVDDISGAGWQERALPAGAVPYGVSFDREGRLYAVDFQNATLLRWDTIDDPGGASFTAPSQALVQMSHVFVHDSDRIFLGMLNLSFDVAAMDDMAGANLVTFGEPGSGVGQFRNPCGVFAK
jgi:DNA-binding beta-propeller fold protein YncE